MTFKCKEKCVCSKSNRKCDAFGHQQCSVCFAIVKKSCGKAACKAANREMISPACETRGIAIAGRKQIRKMNADNLHSSEEENDEDDISEEEENNSEEEETTAIAKRRIEMSNMGDVGL